MQTTNVIAGRYRLLHKLGEGAMGIVWEAENLHTRRRVALKQVIHSNEHHRRRLLKEARACGRLAHRNIIEVLDVGETEGGEPFLVMPLLTGETLGEYLARKRRLAPWLAAKIGRDIARALMVAHAAGIIHRDLKPANTFLHREPGADGVVVKVLDFGVCKELDPKATVLTIDGKPIGTPAYMSPEQFYPRVPLDHRTDIWSLGVVLFEMLTGVRPFRGERVEEVIAKIVAGPIPTVAQLVRSVPAGLVSIVARCLTRDRADRIGTAEELATLLDAYTSADAGRTQADPANQMSSMGAPDANGTLFMSSAIGDAGGVTFAAPTTIGNGTSTVDESALTTPLRRYQPNGAAYSGKAIDGGRGTRHPEAKTAIEPARTTTLASPTFMAVQSASLNGEGYTDGDENTLTLMTATKPVEVPKDGSATARQPHLELALFSGLMSASPRRKLFLVGAGFASFTLLSLALYSTLSAQPAPALRAVATPLLKVTALRFSPPPSVAPAPEPAKPPETAAQEPLTSPTESSTAEAKSAGQIPLKPAGKADSAPTPSTQTPQKTTGKAAPAPLANSPKPSATANTSNKAATSQSKCIKGRLISRCPPF